MVVQPLIIAIEPNTPVDVQTLFSFVMSRTSTMPVTNSNEFLTKTLFTEGSHEDH